MEAIQDIESKESPLSAAEEYIKQKREKLLARTANDPDWIASVKEEPEIKKGLIASSINNIKNLLGSREEQPKSLYDEIQSEREFTVGQQISRELGIDTMKAKWKEFKDDWQKVKDFFDTGKEEKKK